MNAGPHGFAPGIAETDAEDFGALARLSPEEALRRPARWGASGPRADRPNSSCRRDRVSIQWARLRNSAGKVLMPNSTGVKFDRPPVVEVACGILFETTRPLRSAHVGLYWQGIRDEFPRLEDVAPLPPVIESKGHGPTGMAFLGIGPLPPLRRTWFVSADGRNLIQVQGDRFLFNWKKSGDQDHYPSYEEVVERFNGYLGKFLVFLGREGLGSPTYRQFELTYVNQIPIGQMPDGFAVRETAVLVDHVPEARPDRFLPEPESINWTSVYPLPNTEGRLHATARSGFSQLGTRILHLEMTARGIPSEPSEAKRQDWFDQAHSWITRGFADLTAPDVQRQVWKRTA